MAAHPHPALRPGLTRVLALLVAVPFLAGCASFKSTKRLDVGPFAENTVGMIGEVQRATKPVVWTYLKKYEQVPTVVEIRKAYAPARFLMRGVALYSTQVVSIYESNLSEERKCSELAHYLDESVRDRIANNPKAQEFMTAGALDSAVTNCASAKTFLAALAAAQPVVSAALAYGNALYDSVDAKIDGAGGDIDSRIEAEFAPLKQRMLELGDLQVQAARSYTLLSRYRIGEDAALDTLRQVDPEMVELLPPGKKPATAGLDAAEKRLITQLETIASVRNQLSPQFEEYRAQQQELDQLRIQAREGARLGRITLILWARSHRNLANGVTVPAAINVMGMVQSAASKATSAVL